MTVRLPLLALALCVAAAVPATAHAADRVSRLIVYGSDPCPRGQGDEIVVCAREPESERFRIPRRLREDQLTGDNEAWGNKATAMEYVGASGTNSCSPVGTGGWTGCQAKLLAQAAAEKRQNRVEADKAP